MTKYYFILLLLFAAYPRGFAQSATAEKDSARAVVVRLFDALADLDTAKARACCSSDITILESGKVWNFDSLAVRITTRKAKSADFKRANRFEFIETKILDGSACVSYFNYAAITFNGKTTNVKWIETAFLRREPTGWKISLLHSTELERTP